MTTSVDELAWRAPDIYSAWAGIEAGEESSVRREVRRVAGRGSAEDVRVELASLTEELANVVRTLRDDAFALPGGEADWNVAETLGHTVQTRVGLTLAASLAASGRWPADAPMVTPSVPGPADATRAELLRKIAQSQRLIDRAVRAIAGHETAPCPLEHPLVGRLRCGEWLLFAGVHDLMHLEQLYRLARDVVPAG